MATWAFQISISGILGVGVSIKIKTLPSLFPGCGWSCLCLGACARATHQQSECLCRKGRGCFEVACQRTPINEGSGGGHRAWHTPLLRGKFSGGTARQPSLPGGPGHLPADACSCCYSCGALYCCMSRFAVGMPWSWLFNTSISDPSWGRAYVPATTLSWPGLLKILQFKVYY